MNVNKIVVKDRYRKKLTGIKELAKNIDETGLLHPIVINKQKILVCGRRRLEALKFNGITDFIENKHYRFVDIDVDKLVLGEYAENVFRTDFLPTEKVAIINEVMKIKKIEARERQIELGKTHGVAPSGKVPGGEKGEARELATKPFGWGSTTYKKAKTVLEYEPETEEDEEFKEEMVQLMDEKKSVDRPYKKIIQREDKKRIEKEAPVKKVKGLYKTIVIDPPWETKSEMVERITPKYSQMSVDEVIKFIEEEILEHIDEDAHIYIWTLNNRLHETFHIVEQLDLEYKNVITWCKVTKEGKPAIGVGGNFRNATEHIIFTTKGALSLKRQDLPTWFSAQRTTHSTKPDEAYELIEKASHPPYLDVFARKKREGWETMGDVNS